MLAAANEKLSTRNWWKKTGNFDTGLTIPRADRAHDRAAVAGDGGLLRRARERTERVAQTERTTHSGKVQKKKKRGYGDTHALLPPRTVNGPAK